MRGLVVNSLVSTPLPQRFDELAPSTNDDVGQIVVCRQPSTQQIDQPFIAEQTPADLNDPTRLNEIVIRQWIAFVCPGSSSPSGIARRFG